MSLFVQENEALNLYKEALRLRQKGDVDSALEAFHRTLDLPYVEDASRLADHPHLRYLIQLKIERLIDTQLV